MSKQGSKSGKSSKTARVLNLLTDPESIESASESTASQTTEGAKLTDDRNTQAKIRGALEGALEMELSEAAAAAAAPARPKRSKGGKNATSEKNASDSEPRPTQEDKDADAKNPTADWPSAPEPVFSVPQVNTPLESALNELRAANEEKPDEYICYNVMQTLVEDKADKYIKMFGLCNCSRCRIDVIALALSNLPPKYVVAKPHELIPRLSMYEQKYSVVVVTQVMGACRKVLDRPHHQRKQG